MEKLEKDLEDEKESSKEKLRHQSMSDAASRQTLEDRFRKWQGVS